MVMNRKAWIVLAVGAVMAWPNVARADRIVADLSGYGECGLPLSAQLVITVSEDGRVATFNLTNTTDHDVSGNPPCHQGIGESPYITALAFNLGNFDSQHSGIIPRDDGVVNPGHIDVHWRLGDSSGPPPGGADHDFGDAGHFQYAFWAPTAAESLGTNHTLTFSLYAACGNFGDIEAAFENAWHTPGSLGDVQVAAYFVQLYGDTPGLAVGNFRCTGEPIPEPATLALLSAAVAGLGLRRWRRRVA